MRKLFEGLSKEALIDFIEKYAENDAKFLNAVHVCFGKPDYDAELNKIENRIDCALEGTSDYRNHDSWGYIDVDVSGIIAEIKQRAEQGHIRLAFAEAQMLYRKLLENFEYQSECEISDEAEYCLSIMDEIADKAVLAEDRQYIFQVCIELSDLEDGKDYGADYEDKLLKISAKFVTPHNLTELEDALARVNMNWREEEFMLIRLEIIRNIEGENAADSFISEHLRYPKIREIAFSKAMSCGNYRECEQLCLNALPGNGQSHGVSPWLYKLHSVYEMLERTDKLAETARTILLCGDIAYYDKLKSLLMEQGVWDNSYSELLHQCESNLPYPKYMEILAQEQEYALLLEQVKAHTEQIYPYGKLLADTYPIDICTLFIARLNEDAETAYGREAYRKACLRILCFSEAGYQADAIEMISNFILKYKRKPAFVDELKNVQV